MKPHSLFDIGIGTDNLFHKESGPRWTLRFTVENATNKVALYNFLSTFSGTHFIEPRNYQATPDTFLALSRDRGKPGYG